MAEDGKYLVRIEASMKIDVDLYRSGNSKTPRFDSVRDKDIVKLKNAQTGLVEVKGLSGGLSAFTAPKPEGNWWWIKAGTAVPLKLTVTRDRTDPKTGITHYTIRPSATMPLTEYITQMQSFLGVERLSLEEAVARAGRYESA